MKGYQIPLLSKLLQKFFPQPRQKCFSGIRDRENIKERCNKNCLTRSDSFSQLNIWGSEKDIRASPNDKPEKKLNQYIHYTHFKMERLFLLKDILQEQYYPCKIDLKDAYFSVPLSQESYKSLTSFMWKIYSIRFFAIDYISGQYTAYGLFKRGTISYKGYSDISSSEPKVFNKCEEINTPALLVFAIFGHRNQLCRHDLEPFKRKGDRGTVRIFLWSHKLP